MTERVTSAIARNWTPTCKEARALLGDLRRELGSIPRVAACLGLHRRTVDRWIYGPNNPCGPARVLVWLVWSLCFNPENLVRFRDLLPTVHAARRRGGGRGVVAPQRPKMSPTVNPKA
jgi:hypothetical protein